MNHIQLLRFLARGNKSFFDISQKEQESYLLSLGQPKNDIDRSYKQYLCQNYFCSKWKVYFFNLISFILFFPLLLFFILFGLRIRKEHEIEAFTIDLKGMEEIIPDILYDQYQIQMNKWSVKGGLRIEDVPYVLSIFFHHLSSCYFSLKLMIKVAQYSQLITMYSPRCIIAHSEYSFSSSIMTNYCNKRGVKHINVQHGEKLYNIRDSFFRFNECYIWHSHYKNLFLKMGAESKQFVICIPQSLRINTQNYYNKRTFSTYKYYFGHINNDEEILNVIRSTQCLKKDGATIKYRFHPRHTTLSYIQKFLPDNEIENPATVPILESVANCDTAIGSYSTVLTQAYFSNKNVILDDITYKIQYSKLKNLMYILSSVGCKRLSEC